MEHLSDESLFVAYQQRRDVAALSTLFRRRADELLRLAVFLAPRPSDAEDIVQATFLNAIARADTYREGFRVMSWLCGILTNNARMLRRSERRSIPDPIPQDPADDPVSVTLHAELQQVLRQSISQLGEPYSSVLSLHLNDGLNSREISERLHRPPATVRKQMARAMQHLRQVLPLGLATGLVMKMSPAQIANHAADAATFVDGVGAETTADFDDDDLGIWWEATGSPMRTGLVVAGALISALAVVYLLVRPFDASPVVDPGVAVEGGDVAARAVTSKPVEKAAPAARRSVPVDASDYALTITVTDPTGGVHANAEVFCVPDDGSALPIRMLSDAVQSRTTDSFGVARFEGLAPGRYELTAGGSVPQTSVRIHDRDCTHNVILPAPCTYRGTVTDARGHPVAGASVFVSETSGRNESPHQIAVSDATGYFAGTCLLWHGRIFARHPDYSQSACSRMIPDRPLQLELEPLADEILARVVDHEQKPVPGCLVSVVPKSQWSQVYVPLMQFADQDGRCVLPGPGRRFATLIAHCPGMSPAKLDLAPGDTDVVIEMMPSVRIEGVVRTHDGAPFANQEIILSTPALRTNEPVGPLLSRRCRSDEQGRFVFADAPRAELLLRIYGKRKVKGPPVSQYIRACLGLDTTNGEQPPVEIVARALSKIEGRLRTQDGTPVAGHFILAGPDVGVAQHRMFRRRAARTNAEGHFEIDDVAPDEAYHLSVYPPERWWPNRQTWPIAIASATAASPCEIIIDPTHKPSGSVRCQVLRPGGKPARRASIELRHLANHVPDVTSVDLSGRGGFSDLLVGDYWMVVGAPGLGSRTMRVQINSDQQVLDLGAIELQRPARVVVRLIGEPRPANHPVRVVGRNNLGDKYVSANSRKDGTVALPALPPGDGTLLLYGLGVVPQIVEHELMPGLQWLDLELERANEVVLNFTFPLADNPFLVNGPLHVRIFDDADQVVIEDYIGAVSAPGRFDLKTGLRPGKYRVKARALWNARVDGEFLVPADGSPVVVGLELVH